MKVCYAALLEHCIDAGLEAAVYGTDIELTTEQMQKIMNKASQEIWMHLDLFLDFDDET